MTDPTGNKPFLPFARPDITEAEIEAVTQTIRSGWLTTGPNSAAFEKEMAEFLGDDDITCVAVNSATAGLHLAVEALGIGPGDEVLVPTWTFTSTAEVVRYVGADPVLVDVDPVTLNIDFDDAGRKVTERTKAIMPVHLAGIPVDAQELEDFSKSHQLMVVEDAAHAFPVKSNGKMVGNSSSEAVVFSFYATKTITTGEGGMVMVRSEKMAQRMRTMRLHGISKDVFDRYQSTVPAWRYDVVAPGFKYNLPDTAAAMGRVQLGRAVEMRDKRRAIAHRYLIAFQDLPIELPTVPEDPEGHAWHLFMLRIDSETAGMHRDEFINLMSEEGVGTSVHFIPLHLHPYWKEACGSDDSDFPAATREFERTVSLPIFSSMTEEDVDQVIRAVRRVLTR